MNSYRMLELITQALHEGYSIEIMDNDCKSIVGVKYIGPTFYLGFTLDDLYKETGLSYPKEEQEEEDESSRPIRRT